MKSTIIACTFMGIVWATYAYDEVFEKFNVDELVENPKLLQNYANCFLGKGACTQEAKKIKEIIPDALNTDCKKCTENEQVKIKKTMKAYKTKLPSTYEEMVNHFDPKGEHKEAIEKYVNE
nr:venom protein U-MPTX.7-21 [Megalopyge opercularis]